MIYMNIYKYSNVLIRLYFLLKRKYKMKEEIKKFKQENFKDLMNLCLKAHDEIIDTNDLTKKIKHLYRINPHNSKYYNYIFSIIHNKDEHCKYCLDKDIIKRCSQDDFINIKNRLKEILRSYNESHKKELIPFVYSDIDVTTDNLLIKNICIKERKYNDILDYNCYRKKNLKYLLPLIEKDNNFSKEFLEKGIVKNPDECNKLKICIENLNLKKEGKNLKYIEKHIFPSKIECSVLVKKDI